MKTNVYYSGNTLLANVFFKLLLQLFQSNWNNKINMNKNGSLYTSCVIVGTNIKDEIHFISNPCSSCNWFNITTN